MRLLLLILLIAVCAIAVKTRYLIAVGARQSNNTHSFARPLSGTPLNILVIGDSTAVGVGANTPAESPAGRLAQDFPHASIENLGVNGARTKDLIPQFESLKTQHFDIVMIHIGGNDIVRFTPLENLSEDIVTVLNNAKLISPHVFLVTSGDVGTSQLLPFGTRWLFSWRTRQVRTVFMNAVSETNITYVDIYGGHQQDGDPYKASPNMYYSKDVFHPSSLGYENWYGYMRKSLVASGVLEK